MMRPQTQGMDATYVDLLWFSRACSLLTTRRIHLLEVSTGSTDFVA